MTTEDERTLTRARRWVWTLPEIQALPAFDESWGWVYGIVYDDGRLWFGEVFPGLGYTRTGKPQPWWALRQWWLALGDIRRAKRIMVGRVRVADASSGEEAA